MQKISKVLLTGIVKLIGTETGESIDVKSAAYQAVATLSTVFPNVVNENVQLVVQFFNNLTDSPSELHGSIREALVALAQAFNWKTISNEGAVDGKFTPNSNQLLILGVLTDKVDKAEVKSVVAQNVASIFLTTCFPDHFVPARYLLLLIAGSR
jgi:proteasome component ECM29